MSNERPDEFLSWRGRLSRPEALPEQGLDDRELSWEKLAERLREKPRRRWTGYWIAAACLLLALAPVARLFRDRPGKVYLHPSVQRQIQQQAQRQLQQRVQRQALPEEIAGGSRAAIVKPVSARSFHRVVKAAVPPLARLSNRQIMDNHPLSKDIAPPITAPAPLIQLLVADTVNRLTAQRPVPKKPLRIVSINEINKEGWTPAMSTGRAGFFHIGDAILRNGSLFDPASRQDQSKDYLLKINLSFQNH